jgi:protein-tyrosine phosphatase
MREVTRRTSASHPITITWLLDGDLLSKPNRTLSTKQRRHTSAKFSPIENISLGEDDEDLEEQDISPPRPQRAILSNFALSSCPGKRVRLDDGVVAAKPGVDRDLKTDLVRISHSGIKTIVNLLSDEELEYLGVSWKDYRKICIELGIYVIRLPIVDGKPPDSCEDVEKILKEIEAIGGNVLCHCRGGIGRAATIACCYLLRKRLVQTPVESVAHLREKRSPKAVETEEQHEFLIKYFAFLQKMRGTISK